MQLKISIPSIFLLLWFYNISAQSYFVSDSVFNGSSLENGEKVITKTNIEHCLFILDSNNKTFTCINGPSRTYSNVLSIDEDDGILHLHVYSNLFNSYSEIYINFTEKYILIHPTLDKNNVVIFRYNRQY